MARVAGTPLKHGDTRKVWNCEKPCERCDDWAERRRMRSATLPVEPLLAFLPKWENVGSCKGRSGYASMGGVAGSFSKNNARTLWRIVEDGRITPYQADRFACLLGKHPSEIWPEWFEDVAVSQ